MTSRSRRHTPEGAVASSAGSYSTKHELISIAGVEALVIRSLLDRQQFFDPDGAAERLGISPASWPLFGLLWPSAVRLAIRLAQREVLATERILEIGCGLALASIVAHRRGADVTASDRHPLAAEFLDANLHANGLASLKYRHGDWAASASSENDARRCGLVAGSFDLIVGSDVLYERDADGCLATFIARHATPRAEVWIVDPNRGNRPAFTRRMTALGFVVQSERLFDAAANGLPAYRGQMLTYSR